MSNITIAAVTTMAVLVKINKTNVHPSLAAIGLRKASSAVYSSSRPCQGTACDNSVCFCDCNCECTQEPWPIS